MLALSFAMLEVFLVCFLYQSLSFFLCISVWQSLSVCIVWVVLQLVNRLCMTRFFQFKFVSIWLSVTRLSECSVQTINILGKVKVITRVP